MIERPRTAAQFEDWYHATGGDPWNYRAPGIRRRLRDSLSFIARYLPADYSGTLVEFGSFRGDFTLLLKSAFPQARLMAVELAHSAVEEARKTLQDKDGVEFVEADLLDFARRPPRLADGVVLVLLECLYYLRDAERHQALQELRMHFPGAPLFLSAPIHGRPYFTEPELLNLANDCGYLCTAFRVLNLRRLSLARILLRPLTDRITLLRRAIANQVIYCFQPKG